MRGCDLGGFRNRPLGGAAWWIGVVYQAFPRAKYARGACENFQRTVRK